MINSGWSQVLMISFCSVILAPLPCLGNLLWSCLPQKWISPARVSILYLYSTWNAYSDPPSHFSSSLLELALRLVSCFPVWILNWPYLPLITSGPAGNQSLERGAHWWEHGTCLPLVGIALGLQVCSQGINWTHTAQPSAALHPPTCFSNIIFSVPFWSNPLHETEVYFIY